MSDIRIELAKAERAQELIDDICRVYDLVFSAPPFHWREDESDLHRERLLRLLDDSTFGLATASVRDGLVGFAYGYTVPVDTQRWTRVLGDLDEAVTREWPGRTFLLFDYAVLPDYRGRGIGKALHDVLLSSRHEERATLTVQPAALQTKILYERWGWRMIGQLEGGPTAAAPRFDVYLRDRLDDLRASAQPTNP